MAVNLIDSSDITVLQTGNNIQLETTVDMAQLQSQVETNTTDIGTNATNIQGIIGTILWTNPNPTSNFDAQTITLSNDDYDVLEIYYRSGASSTDYMTSTRIIKGNSAILQINHISSNIYHRSRKMDYVNDTSYYVANGQQCPTNSSSIDNNAGYIIPLYIIGYKTGLFS